MPAFEATTAAVYLHGAAGDLVVAERGGESGLMAHDLVEALPRALYRRVEREAR
jgi:NAD(P)H-hydrate repair Nnr-like enzyme with NAD(P)H-hydrate dehydratase domain